MCIALAQMKNAGTINDNLDESIKFMKESFKNNTDLILFPEVQLTEFFPQYKEQDVTHYRLHFDSKEVKKFQSASKKYSIISVPNIYLEEEGKPYDASLMVDKDGEIIGIQKMVHIAQAKQFYEQDYSTLSNEGFKVFDIEYGKIGIVVCFVRHYPESIRT